MILAHDNDRLRNIAAFGQHGFDFAKLDSKPAQLYLSIGATEKLDAAVRKKPSHIAGFIQTGICRISKRIGEEPFGGEFRAVQIAASQTQPANMEFANFSWWQTIEIFIEHVKLCVCDRMADGNWSHGRIDLA